MNKQIRTLIKESVRNDVERRKDMAEAIGFFKKKPVVAKSQTEFPSSASEHDMRSRYHSTQARSHAEASHEFGEEGNYEAEDLHHKAAKAHRLADDALHYDDKEGYESLAKAAHNASREANVFVKEDVESINEQIKDGDKVSWYDPNADKQLTGVVTMAMGMKRNGARHAQVRIDNSHGSTTRVPHAQLTKIEEGRVRESRGSLSEVSYKDENGDTMYYYGDDIGRAFKHVADNYKDQQTGTVNYRSAPDTSKFIAPAHGMIQHLQNVQVAREHPFRPHHFDHFIKIGSNVDRDTADAIKSDIHDYLMDSGHTSVDYKGDPTSDLGKYSKDYIRTVDKDGNPYTLKTVRGTAWGGIGIVKGHE